MDKSYICICDEHKARIEQCYGLHDQLAVGACAFCGEVGQVYELVPRIRPGHVHRAQASRRAAYREPWRNF